MKTGRIKALIGGFVLGLAVPFNVWIWLKEMAQDPQVAEIVFFAISLLVIILAVLVVYESLVKG